ncbi:hypothetical protein WOLCODRAFT_161478 [Wolfiporia cocos MD-104 SS10]|uniref:Uncharacterized protein n=1 Tax=Wolfiporia cocos (strain MD-104) TaxID=742152 RepID=A0A2H3J7W2_WOLCO|nr:hypothetical protein WOLCODRAFT_161478 [Wolfiporia cocos MD-104 SS10]
MSRSTMGGVSYTTQHETGETAALNVGQDGSRGDASVAREVEDATDLSGTRSAIDASVTCFANSTLPSATNGLTAQDFWSIQSSTPVLGPRNFAVDQVAPCTTRIKATGISQ